MRTTNALRCLLRGVPAFAGALLLVACGESMPVSGEQGGGDGQGGSAELIKVLSNRSDLLSNGDALVEIALPGDASSSAVSLNGRDVSEQFARRDNGRYMGLLSGLQLGANRLTARASGASDSATLINHPNGGPVFSGPQIQPWSCPEGSLDAQCNREAQFSYLYKSTNPLSSGLQDYDPENPPSDVATTTTDAGLEVPFIVRVEIGYQNRDQYRIAVLFDPALAWEPWAPQAQWNGKIFVPHGGGCGGAYGAGSAPTTDYSGTFDFLPPALPVSLGDSPTVALSRGFAVMSVAMANTGHNCSVAMNAEALMMAKEHLVEHYGEIRYTIGSGCSGGSIAQQTVANAYPGIYQGLIVTCSFPDTASPGASFFDFHQLRGYLEHPDKWASGVVWNPLQWAAVEGHLLPVNAIVADIGLFIGAVSPSDGCVDEAQIYNAETNPGGVRCGIFDFMQTLFGTRAPENWTAPELAAGRGFAGIPVDNVGVQYGLHALRAGIITPAMFIDLNAKIGGMNPDAEYTEQRLKADLPALPNMYRTGWLNSASNLGNVAIIDHRGPDPALAHEAQWAWTMRKRLDREQGHHDNHVIWYGETPLIGDPHYSTEALIAMDRWMAAIEADARDVPLQEKVVQNRPGDLHDRCSAVSALASPDGIAVPVLQPTLDQLFGTTLGPILYQLHQGLLPVLDPALGIIVDPVLAAVCGAGIVGDTLRTEFSVPRGVADQAGTYDDHKCQLKPLNRSDDYGSIAFSDAEWEQLQQVFSEGVCDYTQPGVGKQHTIPWLGYGDADEVVYGGTPLPARPAQSRSGWNSPAFVYP